LSKADLFIFPFQFFLIHSDSWMNQPGEPEIYENKIIERYNFNHVLIFVLEDWIEGKYMRLNKLEVSTFDERIEFLDCIFIHTLIIGSGAAGLNAAIQCFRNGIEDVLILTEGLTKGTSINTGSDKQTYYKLSMCGSETDSPRMMAESYMTGGSMNGDLALVEASLSARAFHHLVDLGVPFPRDRYGQFIGYKTDHDPRQRATSIGPYTSREMCQKLISEIKRLEIPINEGQNVIEIITIEQDGERRAAGALTVDNDGNFSAYAAENVIFAVGGPGGLYKTSVYPAVQFGGIGIALLAGARARNLTESQFGIASLKYRWNVSGTYMQVIPRIFSRNQGGKIDEIEFVRPYFSSTGEMNGNIFLKGYQWPFDASKVMGGSSLIDLLIYIETMVKGRRVYLDYTQNSGGFSWGDIPDEARIYLERSNACQDTPIERLKTMNPGAVDHYMDHGINLVVEPLEVAVCAQHNNGGLAGNIWWESTNIKHLFPIGEVNGSHGVTRPGGSALNSGQVGGFRAAEFIANRYSGWSLNDNDFEQAVKLSIQNANEWITKGRFSQQDFKRALKEIQERMSLAGAQIRSQTLLKENLEKAEKQVQEIFTNGCSISEVRYLKNAFRLRQLCFSHWIYLKAISYSLESKTGSRGSSIVLDPNGQQIHPLLDEIWKILPEDPKFRGKVLETEVLPNNDISNSWVDCNPIPETLNWFETTWADFCSGEIYNE
jgi:succinate dehydrogenase/fumarate reductase flavoprotein subunit